MGNGPDNLSPLPSKTQTRKSSKAKQKEGIVEKSASRGGEWGKGGLPERYDRADEESEGDKEDGGEIEQSDSVIRLDDGALDRQRSSHGVTTIISGVFTLVLLGVTSYFAYKSIMYSGSESATPPAPLKGEDTLRLVQRIIFPVVASALVLIVFILRSRRLRRITTILLIVLSLIAFLSHLSIAICNLTLTLLWNQSLANRCSWGIDAIWNLPEGSGESYENVAGRNDQGMEWVVAGGLRIFITGSVGLLWMYMLIRWHHSLTKLNRLVILHDAVIANRSAPGNLLPPMPTRMLATHFAHISDATSFVPSVASPQSNGISTWLGARFWQGYGWILGVDPYSSANIDNKGNVTSRGMERNREGAYEDSSRLLVNELPEERRGSWTGEESKNGRIYQQVDLDDPVFRRSSIDSNEEVYHSPRDSWTPPQFPPPSSIPATYTPINYSNLHANSIEHGSSGSTGGNFVYVRMSDGKLVRKLSTIASVASEGEHSPYAGRVPLRGGEEKDIASMRVGDERVGSAL